jgi:hypothetical protein
VTSFPEKHFFTRIQPAAVGFQIFNGPIDKIFQFLVHFSILNLFLGNFLSLSSRNFKHLGQLTFLQSRTTKDKPFFSLQTIAFPIIMCVTRFQVIFEMSNQRKNKKPAPLNLPRSAIPIVPARKYE